MTLSVVETRVDHLPEQRDSDLRDSSVTGEDTKQTPVSNRSTTDGARACSYRPRTPAYEPPALRYAIARTPIAQGGRSVHTPYKRTGAVMLRAVASSMLR